MKRLTSDEIKEIYQKNISKKTKDYDITHYCYYPIAIEDKDDIYFSKKWGINSEGELIYNFKKNWFVNLKMYEENKSFCKGIYGKEV